MIDMLVAARALLTTYGNQLKHIRDVTGASWQDVATACPSVFESHVSEIARGLRCPTPVQADELSAWMARFPDVVQPDTAGPSADHARFTDPVSSDITVKSIAADGSLADKILECARSFRQDGEYVPFDDTDLVEALDDRWKRPVDHPWQRNVVARARGILESSGTVLYRLPGVHERVRHGQTRPTIHFIYRGDTQT